MMNPLLTCADRPPRAAPPSRGAAFFFSFVLSPLDFHVLVRRSCLAILSLLLPTLSFGMLISATFYAAQVEARRSGEAGPVIAS